MVRAMREDAVFGECREPTARARACIGRLTRVRLINVLRESRLRSAALRCALSGSERYVLLPSPLCGLRYYSTRGTGHNRTCRRKFPRQAKPPTGPAWHGMVVCLSVSAMPCLCSCHAMSRPGGLRDLTDGSASDAPYQYDICALSASCCCRPVSLRGVLHLHVACCMAWQ